jgi:hypothetical protein
MEIWVHFHRSKNGEIEGREMVFAQIGRWSYAKARQSGRNSEPFYLVDHIGEH